MYANSLIQHRELTAGSKVAPIDLPSLEYGLPLSSARQVFEMLSSGGELSSNSSNGSRSLGRPPLQDESSRVKVAAIPSGCQNCRHHVFIENDARLETLDLLSTACVAVTQRFDARAGDTLTYDYVVLLQSGGDIAANSPAVRSILVDCSKESAVWLLDRSLDGSNQKRAGSRFRELESFTIPASGQYELRFMTFVDDHHPGSESHLLVDSVRVTDRLGQEVNRLASLSCVGRVRKPALD